MTTRRPSSASPRAVDVVTIEFENLPVAPLARLAELVPVRPAPAVLAICQDRLREKAFLTGIGVATAPWRPVQGADELARAQAELAGPLVLKTARLGLRRQGPDRPRAGGRSGGGLGALRRACRASPRRASTSPARSR